MAMAGLTVAALLASARSAHAPPLALPPGCGTDCADLAEHDSAVISVTRPGIRCVRGSGLSGGILQCRAASSDGGSAAPSFVVDPDDPEQLAQILADGALRDEYMISNWLEHLGGDIGEAYGSAREMLGSTPVSRVAHPPVVAWLRECGCSGLHREATHFVAPLSKLFTHHDNGSAISHRALRERIFTNSCPEDCGFSAEIKSLVDAVAVPVRSFWRMAELTLRRCGAHVGQLRAFDRLSATAKRHWGCTVQASPVLQLVVHIGPGHSGGGPCVWPEAARWLRHAPNTVTISRTMFEVDGIPTEAVGRCNQFDEVWVPASFNLHTFRQSGVSWQRLRSIPEGFDPAIFHTKAAAKPDTQLGIGEDHSGEPERKILSGAVNWGAIALETPQEDIEMASHLREGTSTDSQQQQEGCHVELPTEIRRFITGEPVRRLHARSSRVVGESEATDVRPHFVFLSVFKWEARKGWQELLAAFWAEFLDPMAPATAPRVRLVIKTSMPLPADRGQLHHSDRPVHQVAAWAWELGYDVSDAMAMVLVYDGMLSSASLGALYRASDAFVLATHGEGWGLPLLEAMACGLPTVATAWGGHTDFMAESRGFLVGIEDNLLPAPPQDFGFGFNWARPRHDLLRQALRLASEQDNGTKEVALRGWAWVHEHLQYTNVAQLAMRMLENATDRHESARGEPKSILGYKLSL
jgi:glycosyltransferase involved in cell wall biosynthesis